MKVKVSKWGNSLGVRLPKAAADAAGLTEGSEVDVVVEGRELRLKPAARIPRYRLADMMAEMDRLGPENRPPLVDWGPDVGAEIIDDDYSRGLLPTPGRGSGVGRPASDPRPRAKRRPSGRGADRS
ncbi:AbrB/MazE/SpoVT family DNA-binding domain-containing protein [Rhodoplanes sp. SY1]|uniref:AbrB/MazE/SpoVT family DNA-binding domain-containing protein n=1 Tax=Rhodoplanes sp. SY1 TaxID=3166646 RepID=UPI0038B4EA2E